LLRVLLRVSLRISVRLSREIVRWHWTIGQDGGIDRLAG
jgi:hypothetical protein